MVFSSLEHYKKNLKFCVKGQQNGGEFQDGRQTRIIKFKNILEVFFFKTSKWSINSR
jgi:hypothetical protein